jgi:tetratricopeptide (TPR) repeat protein
MDPRTKPESIASLRQAANFYRQAHDSLLHADRRSISHLWGLRVKRDLGRELAQLSARHLEEVRILLEDTLAEAAGDTTIPPLEIAMAQGSLGQILVNEGRQQEAETAFRQATFTGHQTNVDSDCEPVFQRRMQLSALNGDFAAATQFARQRYQSIVKDYGPENRWAARSQLDWARYRAETGEIAEAMAQVRPALHILGSQPADELRWSPLLAASSVFASGGHFEEAEQLAREAFEVIQSTERDEIDWARAESLELIGTALAGEKSYREALLVLDHARIIYEDLGPVLARKQAHVQELMGKSRQAVPSEASALRP